LSPTVLVAEGVPLVGLEPSCVAVFRDELLNLFPEDERARRLSQHTFLLSEFLQRHGADLDLPRLDRQALVHLHCHHRAVLGSKDEMALLARLGLRVEIPEPGCCGMAGSFGFEAGERYDLSAKIGERALLPAVRGAPEDALVIADGFSCRYQIAEGTGRRPLHLAEVLQLALRTDPSFSAPQRARGEPA
jgi:Fe-S oxidoreductase